MSAEQPADQTGNERERAANVENTPRAEPPESGAPTGHDAMQTPASTGHSRAPSGPIGVRYYGAMNVGLIREHNEDNFTVANLDAGVRDLPNDAVQEAQVGSSGVLLAVCDGMGGAAAGEVASQMAVDTIYEILSQGGSVSSRDEFARRLVYAVEDAGARIFGAAKMDRTRRGMGTTATAAGLVDKVLFVGQVGDSRCYVLRNGQLSLITKDQSLVNQLIEAGQLTEEEAEAFEHSNIILQALGTTEEVAVDLTFLELRRGDRIMLCSDGLSGMVHQEIIREVLAEIQDIPAACARLIEMANAGGGHDNITVVIADFDGEGLAPAEDAPSATYQQYPLPDAPEDEERSTRRSVMKSGASKPGSDVKRPPSDQVATPVATPTSVPGLPLALIALGLMLFGALALFGLFMVFGLSSDEPEPPPPAPMTPPVARTPVELSIRTDIPTGHLFVDGEDYGPISSGSDVQLELPAGPHRIEVRVDGAVAIGSNVTLAPGIPASIMLSAPIAGDGDLPTPEPPQPE